MSSGSKDLALLPIADAVSAGDFFLKIEGGEAVRVPTPVVQAFFRQLQTAPQNILLNGMALGGNPDGSFSIVETASVGTTLFTLQAIDADPGDSHTYTLVSANPSGLVEIDGNALKVANPIDAADVASIALLIQATDSSGLQLLAPKAVTLRVEETPAAVPILETSADLPDTAPTVGNEFRAVLPTWTADPRTIFDHQWMIDLTIPLAGETAAGINPDATHEGRRYRLRTTATAPGRTPVIVFSAESLPVEEGEGPAYPALTPISATHNSVTLRFPAQAASAYRFRWKVGAGSYGSPVTIPVTNWDVAGTVKQVVIPGLTNPETAHAFQHAWQLPDGSWSSYAPSDDSAAITLPAAPAPVDAAPTLTANPTLALSTQGSPQPGTVLSVSPGAATGYPTAMTTTFQLQRNQVDVSGEDEATYAVAEADIGSRLRYEVTISNGVAPDIVYYTSETQIVVALPPTPGTGSGDLIIELAPPNLDCPAIVNIGASTEGTREVPNKTGGSVYQDAIFVAPNPTVPRRGKDYLYGYANRWLHYVNFGKAMLRYLNGRGEAYTLGVEHDAGSGPEFDPYWIDTKTPEEGLPHRYVRAGSFIKCAPGTWYGHNSIDVRRATCSASGVWTITGRAHRGLQSAKIPAVGEVLELVGGSNVAARRRWFRINAISYTGGGDTDFAFDITGTDVTEGLATSLLAIFTEDAKTAYPVREFKCASGVLTIRFVGLGSVEAGSSGKGIVLNQVHKANGDRFYEADEIYHITAWDSASQTATLELRNADSAVTGSNFTIPGNKLHAIYYDSRQFRVFDITNHADCVQVLDHSLPVEVIELKNRELFTYQVIRHNGRAKRARFSECDVSRVDQYDFPEVFPVMLRSQGLDMQNYGATLGMVREFNDVRWQPDAWRDLQASQVAEPNMVWVDGSQNAVRFTPGSAAAVGTTGVITKWNGAGERVAKGQAYVRNYTFSMPEADAAPWGVNLRIMTAADVRSLPANTPLLERFILGPRRGIIYDVTMTNTAGGRFALHTANGGKTRCIARGAATLTAGTYAITLRITSNPIAGRTVGHDVAFNFNITVDSAGKITAAAVEGGVSPPPPPGPPPPPPPPSGFHVDADALITRMNNVGAGIITAEANRIDALIKALDTGGIWPKLDVFYMLRAPSEAEALLDWKPGARNLSKLGVVNFSTALGAKSDGAIGSYLVAEGYNPNTAGGQFSLENAMISFWLTENPGVAGPVIGGGTFWVNAKDGSSRLGFRANDGSTNNSPTNSNTNPIGLTVVQRESAAIKRSYRNGAATPIGDFSTPPTTLTNSPFFILTNAPGTPPAPGGMGFAMAGGYLTTGQQAALKTALDTYFAAL
jgi:hypothetical protein